RNEQFSGPCQSFIKCICSCPTDNNCNCNSNIDATCQSCYATLDSCKNTFCTQSCGNGGNGGPDGGSPPPVDAAPPPDATPPPTIWNVTFNPMIDVTVCSSGSNPINWCCQNVAADYNGNFHDVWAPGEPNTMRVDGTVTPSSFAAALTCYSGSPAG